MGTLDGGGIGTAQYFLARGEELPHGNVKGLGKFFQCWRRWVDYYSGKALTCHSHFFCKALYCIAFFLYNDFYSILHDLKF